VNIKLIIWSAEKSRLLKAERSISFEEITFCIANGQLLDVIQYPNAERYGHQRMFVVRIDQYVYLVPFVESETEIFLKTIIPSRKATRQYLQGAK
jgi:uncharacterized DUF497 family protein